MTGRRRPPSLRPFRTLTGAVAAGALLLSGCGTLPGGSGGSREPVTGLTGAGRSAPARHTGGRGRHLVRGGGRAGAALGKSLRVDTGGLTPVLRWRYEDMLGSESYPRIVNSKVTLQVVRDGRLVAERKGFVDVTRTLVDASATR